MWPLRQVLHDDELLSTWLARSACHLQVPVSALLDAGFDARSAGAWPNDLDVCIDQDLAGYLSEQSGEPIQKILRASALRYDGSALEILPQSTETSWVLGSALRPISGRIGYSICSQCLSTDDTPYFRTHWRLGTTCMCEKHGTSLHDRCLECGAFIFPWRGRQVSVDPLEYCICHRCGADLARQTDARIPVECSPVGMSIFSKITQQLELGTITLPCSSSEQYLVLILRGIRCLVHSLAMLRDEYSRMRSLNRACDYQFGFESWRTSRLEAKPFGPRCIACCGVAALLEDWPQKFVDVCRKVGLRAHHFHDTSDRFSCMPFWLQQTVDIELGHLKSRNSIVLPDKLVVDVPAAERLIEAFFACIDQRFVTAHSVSERWCLARDRTIILAICMGNLPLDDVRHWHYRPSEEPYSESQAFSEIPPRVESNLRRCFFWEHLSWFIAMDSQGRAPSSTADRWLFGSKFKKAPEIMSAPVSRETIRARVTQIQMELGWPATRDTIGTLRTLFISARSEVKGAAC